MVSRRAEYETVTNHRLFVAAAIIILAVVTIPPARADYAVQLQNGNFGVRWTISAVQNLTDYPVSATVYPPNLNYTLTGSDLASFSTALQTSLQLKNSAISVSDVSLRLSSNYINTTCTPCVQWLNATATFTVHVPPQTHFGVAQYDMSWMALRLNEDLSVANIPYNRLGEEYLLTAVLPFVNFTPTSDHTQLMRVNDQTVSKIGYQPYVEGIILFDMSALNSPLQDWSHSMSHDSQTWTSPQTGGFSFTATQHFITENTQIVYLAATSVSAQITTPFNTFAKGNTLYVDTTGGLWEQVYLVIIVASIGAFAISVFIDRRLTKGYGPKRKRGKS